ncbi:MAG: SufE family protein [Fastidiosipilaceae bacterium]|jgi:cysteine desulfuration protein SufE
MGIENNMQEYVVALSKFPDWFSKYDYLLSVACAMDPFPDELRIEENLVKGCQTKTWIYARKDAESENLCWFADSDSMLVKGVLGIVIDIISGCNVSEISKINTDFLKDTGISENFETNRNIGMQSIFDRIHWLVFDNK